MHGTGDLAPTLRTTENQNGPSEHHLRQRDLEVAELLSKLLRKTHQGFKMEPLGVPEGTSILDYLKSMFAGSDTGILTDEDIVALCQGDTPMIAPFEPKQVRVNEAGQKILSYGLSSMGYDVTLNDEFLIFTNVNAAIIDPHNMTDNNYVKKKAETDENGHKYVIIPPNSYLLGVTKEYFDMPPDVLIIAVGKSTYARAGLMINVTPIEPGFKGNVVIEAFNGTPSPMKVYAHEGIAQFMHFRANKRCKVSYGDRSGKYQGQRGMTTARV